MTPEELQARTKAFALAVIRLVCSLPRTEIARVIGGQLLRAGTAVGANYRAVCRARSGADFRAKLAVVEEEADESRYWLELLAESGVHAGPSLNSLLKEANELVAIFTASRKTTRLHNRSIGTSVNR
jgi:four helix bundle protein